TVKNAAKSGKYVWHAMPEEVRKSLKRGSVDETNGIKMGKKGTHATPSEPIYMEVPPDETQRKEKSPPRGMALPHVSTPNEKQPTPMPGETTNSGDVVVSQESGCVGVTHGTQSLSSSRTLKTKHVLHFRGPGWEKVLRKNKKGLESAFKKDVFEATGLEARRIEELKFEFASMLIVTFVVRRENDDEGTSKLHSDLQACAFPRTVLLYRN
ncbi:putative mitotubule-associated protein Gb4, partial [Trypanosoma cruzi]